MDEYKPVLLDCPECKKKVRTMFKMDGIVCARCRTVIEPKYSKAWKNALEEIKKRNVIK